MVLVPRHRAYDRHPPDFDATKEAQRQEKRPTFDPHGVPVDIREQARLRRLKSTPLREEDQRYRRRHITRPGGIDMTDWGTPIHANGWVLLIPQNYHRKRFIIINPVTNAQTLFFAFGSGSQSPIPLYTGGIWDESGSEIAVGNIFVMCSAAVTVGAWEGVPIGYANDEDLV